jgi:hypothetical protein
MLTLLKREKFVKLGKLESRRERSDGLLLAGAFPMAFELK